MTKTNTSAATRTGAPVDIPDFPMARGAGCPFDPPKDLRRLQAQAPITRVRLWDSSTPWLLTRYAEQRALLADPRISADTTLSGYPFVSAGFRERRKQARTFINMDDPEHARLRRMVTAPFAIKRVEALRPAIQRIVDTLIDEMLAGPKPVDLVQAFALPVPSLVISEMLGVPYTDHEFFQHNSKILINRDESPEATLEAQGNLVDYLEQQVVKKLANPADDMLSKLATEQVKTGELTQHDVAAMGMLLLIAGHETTANMIGLGTLALLEHPDQLAALRDTDDPKLRGGGAPALPPHRSQRTTPGRRRGHRDRWPGHPRW